MKLEDEIHNYSDYILYQIAYHISLFINRFLTKEEFEYLQQVMKELDKELFYYRMDYEAEVCNLVKDKFSLEYRDPREHMLKWAKSGEMEAYILGKIEI